MNTESLRQFLLYCGKEGYASLGDAGATIESDQSTSITLEQGAWKFHDNYFGGEPYGGREVVFYKEKPVWIMTYYGQVKESIEDLKPLYTFLRKALVLVPGEAPYRGPSEYRDGEWKYVNKWEGTLDNFSGEERIYKEGAQTYFAKYIGGFVNLK